MMNKMTIDEGLRQANAGHRVRTISIHMVAQCLREARTRGYGYAVGGKVANAYKYQATTAVVAVFRDGRDYYVRFGCCDAHRHSSVVTWFGPNSERERDLESWHRSMTTQPLTYFASREREGWRKLTAQELRGLRRPDPAQQKYIDGAADVTVTIEHSLAAGNCATETLRVAGMLKRKSMNSLKLLRILQRREPHLLPFARRAVDHAARALN